MHWQPCWQPRAGNHSPGDAFVVISFRRAVILWLVRLPKEAIDRELRPFCVLRKSFNSIVLVSRKEKQA